MFINTLVIFIRTYAYNERYPACYLHFMIGVTRLIWHVKLGNKLKKFGNHCSNGKMMALEPLWAVHGGLDCQRIFYTMNSLLVKLTCHGEWIEKHPNILIQLYYSQKWTMGH